MTSPIFTVPVVLTPSVKLSANGLVVGRSEPFITENCQNKNTEMKEKTKE